MFIPMKMAPDTPNPAYSARRLAPCAARLEPAVMNSLAGVIVVGRDLDRGLRKLKRVVLVGPRFIFGNVRVVVRKERNQLHLGNQPVAEVIGAEVDGMATNKEGQNVETGLVPFTVAGSANWISQTQERWLVTARGKLGMTW